MIKVFFYNNLNLTGEKVTTVTTGEDGKTAIYGLPYGTYYLVETEAPAGYNLLTDSKEFTIDANSHMESNMITIKNKIGVLLPSTGGVGTTVYTVCGMALVCIPCLFLYRNKHKKMEI